MSWPQAKLGDAISFIRGVTFKPGDQVEPLTTGSTVVMRTKNVQVAGLDQSDLIAIPSELVRRKEQALQEGDILISSANSWELVGKASYVPRLDYRATAGGFISIVRAKQKVIDSRYLYHWITSSSSQHKIRHCGRQTTNISNLDVGRFKELEIPLPPLTEQKHIAAILDKADAIRRKRQQAIQLADEFLRAVFLDMFGDPVTNPKGFPVTKLGELCEDLFLGLTSKVDYIDGTGGYPLVRAKDINTGELNFDDVRFISEDQHKKLTKNHLTRKGDLLVSKSGTLGTCAIVRTDREFSTYESIFTVRPDRTKLDIHYLIHLLQNKSFKEKLIGNKVGGTVAHLNLKMFRDFEIGVPPIETQRLFSDAIIKGEAKLEKYRQSDHGSGLLFNSLSKKAFSGEL